MSKKERNDVDDYVHGGGDTDELQKRIEGAEPVAIDGNRADHDSGEIDRPGPIPPNIIDMLPEILRLGAGYMDNDNAKTVFLTGAFPVIAGCLPNVRIVHGDGPTSPNLYTLVCAGAATGKGVLRYARRLGNKIDEFLDKTSKQNRALWQRKKKSNPEEDIGPEPPIRSFFLPGNSSHRALIDSLQANEGQGVICESELLTVLIAEKNDWGNYRDILLSSAHGEVITLNRRGGESIRIESPAISVAITGTQSSFTRMFPSMEDGLFSRFNFFTFSEPLQWRSHRPSDDMQCREKFFEDQAVHLLSMYKALSGRTEPLYMRLENEQWNRHDKAYDEELRGIPPGSDFGASVRRSGMTAVRVAAIVTVLRLVERNASLATATSVTITDDDLQIGIEIARLWLSHARYLQSVARPNSNDVLKDMTANQRELYLHLSQFDEFSTGQAKQAVKELGITISERTVENWLAGAMDGFIRLSHGRYKTALSGIADSSSSSVSRSESESMSFDPINSDIQEAQRPEYGNGFANQTEENERTEIRSRDETRT